MAIRGSLREASLPDVLQLLAMGQKTGCLSVANRSSFGSIYFDKGRICFASIVNRRDRLGDILVKSGRLQPSQLAEAIALQERAPNVRLGDLLVTHGMITREVLDAQIRVQIEEAVYFLFTWTQGTFNFESDVRPESQDVLVSISPDALLLEGARRIDEWSLIEKKIPTFDLIFAPDHTRLRDRTATLTSEQALLLELIDGQRDVQQLIDASGLVDFEVGKALYGLLTAGFLHQVGRSRAEAVTTDGRIDEHRNLGIAFYRTAMFDEAAREFRRVLELQATDEGAQYYLGLILLREAKWADAAALFREVGVAPGARAAVFHNLAYALERLGRLDEAWLALDEAARRGLADDPRLRTSRGIIHMHRGELAEADAELARAREGYGTTTPSGAWFHAASLVAALRGEAARAASILADGIGAHPHAAPLFNNRAVVLERSGDRDGALAVAERGVLEDATLPQLHKNVGDAHYRAGRATEALAAYQRAVKLAPLLGPDVHLKMGNIRFKAGERAEAIRSWEIAQQLDPANTIVRANLETVRRMS